MAVETRYQSLLTTLLLRRLESPCLTPDQITILLCVAFTAAGHSQAIAPVLQAFMNSKYSPENPAALLEKVRMAFVKTSFHSSFPRILDNTATLNSATALMEYAKEIGVADRLRHTSNIEARSAEDREIWNERGKAYFQKVYGGRALDLKRAIEEASPDHWSLVSYCYGHILSNTAYMDEIETQLAIIVALDVMSAGPQLSGHITGATLVGASNHQMHAARLLAYEVKMAVYQVEMERGPPRMGV